MLKEKSLEESHLKVVEDDSHIEDQLVNEGVHYAEKFDSMVTENWDAFCCVVKKIVQTDTEQSTRYLKLIDLLGSDQKIGKLNTLMSIDEKNAFSRILESSHKYVLDINQSYNEFSNEIKKMSLGTSGDLSFDKIMMTMTVDKSLNFIKDHPDYAASLITFLPKDIVANIFNALESEEVFSLMELATKSAGKDINELKKILIQSEARHEKNFFYSSIIDVTEDLSDRKQSIIMDNLLELGEIATVKKLASRVFPSECFLMLDKSILRDLTNYLEIEAKVQLLAALEDEERNDWLDFMSDEGSKSREMITMELSQLTDNEAELSKVRANKESILENVYSKFRKTISDEKFQSIRDETIKQWIAEKQS